VTYRVRSDGPLELARVPLKAGDRVRVVPDADGDSIALLNGLVGTVIGQLREADGTPAGSFWVEMETHMDPQTSPRLIRLDFLALE
jgi:hypothetical protein